MSLLDKIMSGIKPFIDTRATSPINPAQETKPLFTPATFAKNLAENDSVLKTVASSVTADADPQIDSRRIFKQEIEQVDKQKLSRTADKTVRVRFSKPAEQMNYDDYTRDYLRAMLRETGVSKASDEEINRFQALLKDATGGDGFGVEDKAEQARMTTRYRAAQTSGGGEADWGTSPQARAQVLAGAGAILRERVAAGARLGAAQQIGQEKASEMALDVPKVFVRAAINTAEGAANMAIEIADPSIRTDPHNWTRAKIGDIMDGQLPPPQNGAREHDLPRVNAEPLRPEYKSDVFNRDVLTGKVNKDGLTVGKLTETGVELAAPVVAGKVFAAAEAPQSLGLGNAAGQTTEVLVYEADAMAKAGGSGRVLIGRRAKAEEITAVAQELEVGNVNIVKNADARINKLNVKAAAVFDFEKGEMLLRKDATFLEVFHEKTHAKQWIELGKEQYKAMGTLAREEHVYKTIVENKHLFSQRELDEATAVIQNYRIQKSQGRIN